MFIPDYFRRYIRTLTIDDIKSTFSESDSNDLNNVFQHSTRFTFNQDTLLVDMKMIDHELEMIYYIIKNGYPRLFFDNAIDYNRVFGRTIETYLGFKRLYFDCALDYYNKIGSSQKHVDISESGILMTHSNEFYYCVICDNKYQKQKIKYYDYYFPTKYNEYLEGITLCSLHMENIFNLAEKKIFDMYNILLYKYQLIKCFNVDIDSTNYIFILYIYIMYLNNISKNDIIYLKYKFKMSDGYRKYIQKLTIDDIKNVCPLSNKVDAMFGESLCNTYPRRRENVMMIYYLIRSGYPIEFFENTVDTNKLELSYNKYLNKHITENGIMLVAKDRTHNCSLCGVKECTTTYYYYYPKIHNCYYPSTKYYEKEDKDLQFDEMILCTVYMKRIFDFAEECILNMYNTLFNKYIFIKCLDIDIDSVNHIFILSL